MGEVRERAFLSDLDVLKGISDLLDRALIEEGYVRESAPASATRSPVPFAALVPWLPVIVVAAFSIALMPRNPANLLLRPGENVPISRLVKSGSVAELTTLGRAVRDLPRLDRKLSADPGRPRRPGGRPGNRVEGSLRPVVPVHPSPGGREVRDLRSKRIGRDRPRPRPRGNARSRLRNASFGRRGTDRTDRSGPATRRPDRQVTDSKGFINLIRTRFECR